MRYCFVCDQPVSAETCPVCGRATHATPKPARRLRIPEIPRRLLVAGVIAGLVLLFLLFQVRWGIR